MAVKFSQFVVETDKANVNYLVGWDGTENVQITPADLLGSYPSGPGAAGQVAFFDSGSTLAGDNDLYWDNTNKRLGIGTATPGNKLEVQVTSNGHGVLFKSNTTQIGSILRTAIGGTVSMTIDGAGTRPININNSSSSNVLIANGGGNVGIGTTSPSAKLEVDGTLIATGVSQLGSGGSNVLLTSSSAGNVGIGDSSPTAKLVVNNTGTKMLELRRNNNIKFRALADANHAQLDMFNSSGTKNISLHTNSVSYFNGGNVGIGTVSPETLAHIKVNGGSAQLTLEREGGGAGKVVLAGAAEGFIVYDDAFATKMYVGTSGTYNGNVGIGTISPTQKLDVDGAIITEDYRSAGTFFLTSGDDWRFRSDTGSERMRITSGGNVGIGTSSPSTKLHVAGIIQTIESGNTAFYGGDYVRVFGNQYYGFRNTGGSTIAQIHMNGNSYFNGGNVGIGTSSPAAKLEVKGATAENTQIRIQTDGGASEVPTLLLRRSSIAYGEIKYIPDGGGNQGVHITDYRTDVSNIIFNTAGANERMRIDTSGNVGIGTITPGSKLHIDEAGTISPALFIDTARYGASIIGDGTSNSQYLLNLQSNGGSTDVMRVQSSGNVGIGTNSPNALLHLESASSPALQITDTTQPTTLRLYAQDSNTHIANITAHDMVFDTNNIERMRVTSTGNVGIGTTSPSKKLEVVSNNTYDGIQISGSSIPTLGIIDTTNNAKLVAYVRDSDATIGTETNHPLTINTNNTERMRIDSAGNVGIGSTSPTSRLTVAVGDIETSGVGYGLILKSPNGTRYRVTVDNSGNLSTTAV